MQKGLASNHRESLPPEQEAGLYAIEQSRLLKATEPPELIEDKGLIKGQEGKQHLFR